MGRREGGEEEATNTRSGPRQAADISASPPRAPIAPVCRPAHPGAAIVLRVTLAVAAGGARLALATCDEAAMP